MGAERKGWGWGGGGAGLPHCGPKKAEPIMGLCCAVLVPLRSARHTVGV